MNHIPTAYVLLLAAVCFWFSGYGAGYPDPNDWTRWLPVGLYGLLGAVLCWIAVVLENIKEI